MRQLYLCVANQHDLRFVALAALVCVLGCYATFAVGIHAVLSRERSIRAIWGFVSLFSTTCAIWATHFVAMLAYRVPFPSGFLLVPTIASFVVAGVLVGVAGTIALRGRSPAASTIAGAITGLAISAMHYTGMSAFRAVGTITWDWPTVAVSVLIGSTFAALAGYTSWNRKAARVWTPTALLTLAVCGDHFVAMSAATVAYDPSVVLPNGLIAVNQLAPVVAALAGIILLIVLVAHRLHLQMRQRFAAERRRFHDLADFAVEGLVICDGARIVWVNRSIVLMTDTPLDGFVGRSLDMLFPAAAIAKFSGDSEVDATVSLGKVATPVRVITKAILFESKPHVVIAVRDQRERLRAEAEMRRLADTDTLTGLANRGRFNDHLGQLLASRRVGERSFALLSLDLDRFKHVNDAHGHATGDALLLRVAKRLASVVRDGGLVARIGGDEFSIIATSTGGLEGVRALADRLVEIMSRPFLIDGRVHEIGTSIGVAFAPSDGSTAEALIRNADLALYRAKGDGGGVYRLFETSMDAQMQVRRGLELALRKAVARQEFHLAYQPQVDSRTGECTGAEALIRWVDPERGDIPPSAFIPIAEETNLIAGIGEWVLHTACAEAMKWPSHLTVAVNLSPLQFRDPRLLSIVTAALEESGLPGSRLELEITESALIDDEAGVLEMLNNFRELGIRLSLDDFGTGYSSLGHLHRFPFDRIKIDRSFVSRAPEDRESAAIVRAIVSLGASLGMTTTAEGVETDAQHRFVAGEGCDHIQGFLFSRPVLGADLPAEFSTPTSRSPSWHSSDSSIAATAS